MKMKEKIYAVYTSEQPKCMNHHPGNVFMIIGPFKEFTDKPKLRSAIEKLLIEYNKQ